jgi:hypothetical protein
MDWELTNQPVRAKGLAQQIGQKTGQKTGQQVGRKTGQKTGQQVGRKTGQDCRPANRLAIAAAAN